jgi:hypothetical protein
LLSSEAGQFSLIVNNVITAYTYPSGTVTEELNFFVTKRAYDRIHAHSLLVVSDADKTSAGIDG